jgi:hypothetical protein
VTDETLTLAELDGLENVRLLGQAWETQKQVRRAVLEIRAYRELTARLLMTSLGVVNLTQEPIPPTHADEVDLRFRFRRLLEGHIGS